MVGTWLVSPAASTSLVMSFAVASDMNFGRKRELIEERVESLPA